MAALFLVSVAPARAVEETHIFNIPAGPAVTTLPRVALIANIEILFEQSTVDTLRTRTLRGQYTVDQALQTMLKETPCEVVPVNEGEAYTIVRRTDAPSDDSAALERSFPPNFEPHSPMTPKPNNFFRNLKRTFLSSLLVTSSQVVLAQENSSQSQTYELSPYEVNSSLDVGYYAGNSISATKTAVAIKDIPINIQVMTRDFIEDVQAYSIDEALIYVAGAAPDTNEPGRYTIRGFTSPEPIRNGVSTLAEFHQGTTLIERVEVVKGPASILYGISEPGGIINYITKQPLSVQAGSVRFIAGSYNKFRTEVDVTGPLSKGKGDDGVSVDYRLITSYENSDSWVDYAGIEEFIIAPSLKWQFGENTSLLATIEYYDVHRNIEGTRIQAMDQSGYLDLPARFNPAGNSYKDTETIFANTDFQHKIGDNWTFRNVLNISENDYTQDTRLGFGTEALGPADPGEIRIHLLNRDVLREQFTSQTEMTGEFEFEQMELNILFGHEFQQYDQRQIARRQNNVMIWDLDDPATWDISFPVAPEDRSLRPADIDLSNDPHSFFGMLQGAFMERRLRTLLGLRYDILNGDLVNFNAGGARTENPEVTSTTPQVGALYQISGPLSFYALYSESFTPNLQVNPDGSTFDPATGKGKEFGFKFDLIEKRISTTLSFYEIEKDNIVRIDQEAQQADPPVLRYVSSGNEKSKGTDLDLIYSPTENYQLIMSYAHISDAYVVSNNDAPETEGMRLASSPEDSFSIWNKYIFTEGSLEGFFLGGGFVHRDESQLNTSPASINIRTPAYDRFDLSAGYSGIWGEKPIRIEVKLNNLTDETYHLRQSIIAPGRNFQTSFRLQF